MTALVRMVRDASEYPPPHQADVHPEEIRSYGLAGFEVAASVEPSGEKEGDAASAEDCHGATIPDGWRDLPWSKPGASGLTLRGLASSVSDTPILNKGEAVAAIEAELQRRGGEERSSAGLTRRELDADLEALGIPPDPDASQDDLQALRDTKRAELA